MVSACTRFLAAFDPVARALGGYTAYTIAYEEYVGTLPTNNARAYLRDHDYEPQYLSAAKRLPGTGALHDLSYRHVPTEHPPEWNADRYAPDECQYHVHVWETPDGPLAFSHYEVRPFADPLTHYRPSHGQTYLRGVTNLDVSHD